MSTVHEQAQAFLGKAEELGHEALREALDALPEDVKDAYWVLRKAAHFDPKNERIDSRKEHLSPSGRFKLITSRFSTGPGSWDYSQGKVYHAGSDVPLATVQRNYGAFPFTWVEAHPDGNDYLIAGQDYQGQTVIELDTGLRVERLSPGTEKGHGFCWAEARFDAATQMLIVCGCIWACPYEFRFYDFSHPMDGWPEIEPDTMIEEDRRWPVLEPDGVIRCFQSEMPDDKDDDEEDDTPEPIPEIAATSAFKREGLKLVRIKEEVSDKEQARRLRRIENERKYEEWKATFKATDPLYLTYITMVKDPALSPEDYESIGQTHENWCKDFTGRERRWCRRIVTKPKGAREGFTVDLEWGVELGPVKLAIYKDGKVLEDKFFEHSVAGMSEAFAYAKFLGVADGR